MLLGLSFHGVLQLELNELAADTQPRFLVQQQIPHQRKCCTHSNKRKREKDAERFFGGPYNGRQEPCEQSRLESSRTADGATSGGTLSRLSMGADFFLSS